MCCNLYMYRMYTMACTSVHTCNTNYSSCIYALKCIHVFLAQGWCVDHRCFVVVNGSSRFSITMPRIKSLITKYGDNLDMELQQRAVEYTAIFSKHDEMRFAFSVLLSLPLPPPPSPLSLSLSPLRPPFSSSSVYKCTILPLIHSELVY